MKYHRLPALALSFLGLGGCAASPPTNDGFAPLRVGFSPVGIGTGAEALVLAEIEGARKSIHIAALDFTDEHLAQVLEACRARGIDVRLVVDATRAGEISSLASHLDSDGVPVHRDGRYAAMNHQFMVIDGTRVETGSFSFTRNAALRSAEDALVLDAMPEIGQAYEHQWQRLWDESD